MNCAKGSGQARSSWSEAQLFAESSSSNNRNRIAVSDRGRESCSWGIFRASCPAGTEIPALPINQVPVAHGEGVGRARPFSPPHALRCPGSGSALLHPTELGVCPELAKGRK